MVKTDALWMHRALTEETEPQNWALSGVCVTCCFHVDAAQDTICSTLHTDKWDSVVQLLSFNVQTENIYIFYYKHSQAISCMLKSCPQCARSHFHFLPPPSELMPAIFQNKMIFMSAQWVHTHSRIHPWWKHITVVFVFFFFFFPLYWVSSDCLLYTSHGRRHWSSVAVSYISMQNAWGCALYRTQCTSWYGTGSDILMGGVECCDSQVIRPMEKYSYIINLLRIFARIM